MKEVQVRTIIEIVGAPEDHVNKTMGLILKKLDESIGLKVTKKDLFKAKKIKDKPFWSTFVEIEMKVSSLDTLMGFCFDFMPSSIEILNTEELGIKNEDTTSFLNELLGRLHQYDMTLKNIFAENMILKEEIEKLSEKK